jgi:hypothetical protein
LRMYEADAIADGEPFEPPKCDAPGCERLPRAWETHQYLCWEHAETRRAIREAIESADGMEEHVRNTVSYLSAARKSWNKKLVQRSLVSVQQAVEFLAEAVEEELAAKEREDTEKQTRQEQAWIQPLVWVRVRPDATSLLGSEHAGRESLCKCQAEDGALNVVRSRNIAHRTLTLRLASAIRAWVCLLPSRLLRS